MVYYCAGWVSIVIELLAVPLVLAQVEPLKVFNAKFVESIKLEKDNTSPEQNNKLETLPSNNPSKLIQNYP